MTHPKYMKGSLSKSVVGIGKTSYHVPHIRYAYVGQKDRFEVDVRDSDGYRTYHINCGVDIAPRSTHRRIERHFGLTPTGR